MLESACLVQFVTQEYSINGAISFISMVDGDSMNLWCIVRLWFQVQKPGHACYQLWDQGILVFCAALMLNWDFAGVLSVLKARLVYWSKNTSASLCAALRVSYTCMLCVLLDTMCFWRLLSDTLWIQLVHHENREAPFRQKLASMLLWPPTSCETRPISIFCDLNSYVSLIFSNLWEKSAVSPNDWPQTQDLVCSSFGFGTYSHTISLYCLTEGVANLCDQQWQLQTLTHIDPNLYQA